MRTDAWLGTHGPRFPHLISCMLLLLMATGVSECESDEDRDGWTEGEGDCDDSDETIHPGATEVCDGIDQDCDDEVDEGLTSTWYPDEDQDGYGGGTGAELCDPPEGYTAEGGDCDDQNAAVFPGASEGCNGVDDDCDGAVDEGLTTTYYRDEDGDGYGLEADPSEACALPEGYAAQPGDCDDGDAATHPEASEDCNGVDDDCDGSVDEEVTTAYYRDEDGDGYGLEADPAEACALPEGYAAQSGDCDDGQASTHPGASEDCNGVDEDCDGAVDEEVTTAYYRDEDGDGYGATEDGLEVCSQPEGYLDQPGDCDDQNADVFPGASERCNGVDDDCDHTTDEGVTATFYQDGDGDGFGDEAVSVQACAAASGFSVARGDCDDADPTVHPGAEESPNDGLDADCGGTDGGDPHVGLSETSFATLQEALDAAVDLQTVWVGPGTYLEHGITMEGKAVSLRSTEGEANTILDGEALETVFVFEHEETGDSLLDGFTLVNGSSPYGGGVSIESSSPTLIHLTVTGSSAENGAGLSIRSGAPHLSQITVTGNTGYYSNARGGGMYLLDAMPVLTHVSVSGNVSEGTGGGIHIRSSSPTLNYVNVTGNKAREGGGMYVTSASLTMTNVTVSGNTAVEEIGLYGQGGGLLFLSSSGKLTNVLVVGNVAGGAGRSIGGGLYLNDSSPTMTNVTVSGNTATTAGGGIYLLSASPVLTNVILSHNIGMNLYRANSSSQPTLAWCDLYSAFGDSHNLDVLDDTNLEVDPLFLALSNDGDATNDDLRLRPNSPLLNAGAPDLDVDGRTWETDSDDQDPDGTRADMGAYGGPDADWSGYQDADADGLYDTWEISQGLDPSVDDSEADGDGDGASNAEELAAGTDADMADSDGDGHADGVELEAGTDPLNPCEQPGMDGLAALRVPEDYETIQDAIDAVVQSCRIEVAAGTYEGLVRVEGKGIELVGVSGAEATILDGGQAGSVITGVQAWLRLEGLTITGGSAKRGGGMSLQYTEGTLELVSVYDNTAAEYGGGIYLYDSAPSLSQVTVTGNTIPEGDGSYYCYGGGMYLDRSSPTLSQVTLAKNSVSGIYEGYGGGLYMNASSPILNQVTLTGNSAFGGDGDGGHGGGMYLFSSSPTMTELTVSDNTASYEGGGMATVGSDPTLTVATFSGNSALFGGGMYMDESSPLLFQVTIADNFLTESGYASGGGIYLNSSSPSLQQVILTGNIAGSGGAIAMVYSAPTLNQVLISGNTTEREGGGLSLLYSDPFLSQVLISGNVTAGSGGAMQLEGSSPSVIGSTIAGNEANSGAGMYLRYASNPTLSHVIIAHNRGTNLHISDDDSGASLRWCDLYNPFGVSHNLETLDPTNVEVDPAFVLFFDDGDPTNDALELRLGSPLIDAGAEDLDGDGLTWETDPDDRDPDGTRADIGFYSGPEADWSGYIDTDQDGIYDTWELAYGLDADKEDGKRDADEDGANNIEEFEAGTDPLVMDSDTDGSLDGEELIGGSDPLDFCSRPGIDGPLTLYVPEDYPTIQDAIDVVDGSCWIAVAAGTYEEQLWIEGKGITLIGVDGTANTILTGGGADSVITAKVADLWLEGFTISGGGSSTNGGGMNLKSVEGGLEALIIQDNTATSSGGGFYVNGSSLVIANISVINNSAQYGGGIRGVGSSLSMDQLTVANNTATYSGGGLYLRGSSMALSHISVFDNAALRGGGIYLSSSSSALSHISVFNNTASSEGGGIYLTGGFPDMVQIEVVNNVADSYGGGIYLSASSPRMHQVIVAGNATASYGGGMYLRSSSSPIVTSGIIAYNTGVGNLFQYSSSPGSPSFAYSDVYDPEGDNLNGLSLDDTALTLEPGFLMDPVWDEALGMWLLLDPHLGLDSPLIDAGPPEAEYNDLDGSRADLGSYGGLEGAGWDRDGDGFFDWFWPGPYDDAPAGYEPLDWDVDDWDAATQ